MKDKQPSPKGNKHHHLVYADAFPRISYTRTKSGKCFVYDNRRIYHGQLPIAEIDDTKPPIYKLKRGGEIIHKGSLKECLRFASDNLLQVL